MKYIMWKWVILVSVFGGGVLAFPPLEHWWRTRNVPQYRTSKLLRGDLVSVVNSTGTVTPVLSVRVGSFASGPVVKLHVDYNTPVKKDGLLAEIDPTLYEAVRDRDAAALNLARADVGRVSAQLLQAKNDFRRAKSIRSTSKGGISEEELDKYQTNLASLEAQLAIAQAQVKQAEANLRNSEKNLSFTKIRSPVDGVVIDRKIEEGQTLVAQFQVPDLFVVAKDLVKEIHVYASIDEADIEQVRRAQRNRNPVHFTVDSHPEDLFEGRVYQVRLNPTTKENVVTYSVVVSCPNPDMRLLPGMTAKLSLQIDLRKDILKVPNAALRFYPKVENVREEDRKVLEVTEEATYSDSGDKTLDSRSATRRVLDRRKSNQRHVWVVDLEGRLRAVPVTTGISDHKYTELLSGELDEGQELVTGTKK